MTFLRVLLIFATLSVVSIWIFSYKRYILGKATQTRKATKSQLAELFIYPLITFVFAFIIWISTPVVISLTNSDRPIHTSTQTIVSSEEQSVVFKEQTDNEYIVSIDGVVYNCTDVVISNDIQKPQVVFVKHQWADKFAYFFLYELVPLPDNSYKLYIPMGYISPIP